MVKSSKDAAFNANYLLKICPFGNTSMFLGGDRSRLICGLPTLRKTKNKSLKKLCASQTQTRSICFLFWVIGGLLTAQVTVLCLCNYRIIVISITE